MRWYADLSDTDWDRGFDLTLRLAMQFPPALVVFQPRPQLVDNGCEIIDEHG
jgi:hypothetical protein